MFLTVMAWVGTGAQLIGATYLASNTKVNRQAYLIMLIGSIVWGGIAIATRQWPLLALNAGYSIINIIGVMRYGDAGR